jgi:preprotein translocase subunit SecB
MAKKPTKKELAAQEAAAKEAAAKAETEAQEQQAAQGPMLSVLAQYTKDQSFENPNAPDSLRSGLAAPEIQIGIEIGRQMLEGDNVEVTLMLRAEARRGEQVAFIAELEYAGLFAFQGVNVEEIQPLILIECPRLLFPFARQIMAEMTQNGGYPPIMLEPPDFAAMFRDEMMRRAAEAPTN